MDLVSHSLDSAQSLELSGRFDAHGAPQVSAWFEQNLKPGDANVIVNLGGVNFIDSTALATLVQGMKRARQADGDLRLCNMQQPVRIIFELTRLDRAFEIFPDEAHASNSFAVH